MVITFAAVLFGLLFLIRPLQKNAFYMLHCGLVIIAAQYVESNIFKVTPFAPKTFLLFVAFQFISINIVTFLAYYIDKNAAQKGKWRVPEIHLHTLEFLGGWSAALFAQKFFNHKTKKKSYQAMFWFVLLAQSMAVYLILKFLKII